MALVHLFCGKICSGKSTLAKELAKDHSFVVLNCDEIMTLFPPLIGDETYARVSENVKRFLYQKTLEIVQADVDVILDWGFWYKAERRAAEDYFTHRGIPVRWYYLDVSDETWEENIARRNKNLSSSDYLVDEGLKNKCLALFEPPDEKETAGWFIVKK